MTEGRKAVPLVPQAFRRLLSPRLPGKSLPRAIFTTSSISSCKEEMNIFLDFMRNNMGTPIDVDALMMIH
jgi:hypothetical protein